MKEAVILTIHGKVQGTGFRFFIQRKAEALGLTGFVRNHADGTVHVEAEGEPLQLQLLIAACQRGPEHAHIEKVDIQFCPVVGHQVFWMK